MSAALFPTFSQCPLPECVDAWRRVAPPSASLRTALFRVCSLRILRRQHPPDFVEPQPLQSQQRNVSMALMGRIERPTEQADSARAKDYIQAQFNTRQGPVPHTSNIRCRRARGKSGARAYLGRASWTTLAGAANNILEAGELLRPDRAARMQLACGDADLGAHAELALHPRTG